MRHGTSGKTLTFYFFLWGNAPLINGVFPFLFALCANVNKVLKYNNVLTLPNVNKKLKYENVASSSDVNALFKKTITLILTSQSATSRLVNKMLKYKSVRIPLFSWEQYYNCGKNHIYLQM